MRLRCALVLAALLVAPAAAHARHERVSVTPRVGDVNTTFVYRGSGWRPHARVAFEHGALCADYTPCTLPLYVGFLRADKHGRFRTSEHPALFVPDAFVGYGICFSYAQPRSPAGCRAKGSITVVPASASISPARTERFADDPSPQVLTLEVEHFKAGERLGIEIRYPDGRVRTLHGRARRHAGAVGAAYVRRGGLIRAIELKSSDPDGTYVVRVTNKNGAEADTSYTVTTG